MTEPARRIRDRGHSAVAPHDGAPAIQIRRLHSHDDFAACVALQHETWGEHFSERVPMAILKVAQRLGGITAGAFDASGQLAGFVFGMTGVEAGQLVHWSDMLAVRPELRDHGIGRRLKEFQRDALRTLGVTRIYWTFDPLVARNAHLNINRLGVEITEYAVDMYGSETDSALHRGLGTDRFIAAWAITGAPPGESHAQDERAVSAEAHAAPVVNPADRDGLPAAPDLDALLAHDTVRVEIPLDITRVQETSTPLAGRWRAVTRAAFQCALEHGYRVAGFYRDAGARRAFYIVSRTLPSAGTP